jgi:activator of HSP90 ATPase
MLKTKDLKQGLMIRASAHAIYEALMDSKKHAKFTSSPAKISRIVGGSFTAHGDYISGKNLELIPDKKIVQSWRASNWPVGHSSTITYLLKETKNGTKLMFSQKGIPMSDAKNITGGWKTYYWEPLKKMLEK